MRVLMINYEYPPIGGGGSNATAYMLREIRKEPDLWVDLVTSSVTMQRTVTALAHNTRMYRLPVWKRSPHYWRECEILAFAARATLFAKELVRHRQYDVCHAIFGFPSGFVAYLLRRRLPYILSLRGSDVPGFNVRFAKHYILLKPLLRRIWRGAARVVANSEGLRHVALGTAPSQDIDVIPNGVDTDLFSPGKRKSSEDVQILCVCRLVECKGIDYLLKALPIVVEKFPGTSLKIVGDGPLETRLRALSKRLGIDGHVEFTGRVPHDCLPEHYSKADIFVLPSLSEGMPNAVLEAMASGLPVVITDTGGAKELVDGNGCIVPCGDTHAIGEALLEMVQGTRQRMEMGRKSRCIAESMSWRSTAKQYIHLYRQAGEHR